MVGVRVKATHGVDGKAEIRFICFWRREVGEMTENRLVLVQTSAQMIHPFDLLEKYSTNAIKFPARLLTRTFANRRSSSEAFGIGWRFLLLMLGCRM
jgi:hypothetical protein